MLPHQYANQNIKWIGGANDYRMTIDWQSSELFDQLAAYKIPTASTIDQLFAAFRDHPTGTDTLVLSIDGLESYTESWGVPAGVWLILSVLRMIIEILEDYQTDPELGPKVGCVPPDTFGIIASEDHQQEIGHRCLTGYQEIYAILVRTHRKPSSPIWHRRAATQYFPQLIFEIHSTDSQPIDESDTEVDKE
jgi:hypothetical protein